MFITARQLFLRIFLCFICITNTVTLAQPDFIFYFCANNDNYTINSTFERNLDTTFSTLPTTNSGLGFFNHSTPEGNDMVYSAAICRGDIEPDLCLSCLNDSMVKLRELCPNQKEAVGYYEMCWLKYSTQSVLGNIYHIDGYRVLVNTITSAQRDRFVEDLSSLMNKLKADAAAGDSLLKFAAGNTTGPDFVTIYGLVQCTPDLSKMQCIDCLENAYSYYATVFNQSGKIGGTVFQPMCRYSYGLSRFFNEEGIPSPPVSSSSPSLPPVSSSPSLPGTKCNSVCLSLSIYTML
ncbi:putative Gnk2-like domain-containing protein [Helianthus annuus]|nr:putative Gnk2-like domain-containing protein [Helianthus annuus]